jgi:ABC-2 type transport system ATP-binding protein
MLEIKNLNFAYPKSGKLFDGLDLEVSKGSVYGLLGRNGAGKSTLLKIICGLLYSNDGHVLINGDDVAKRLPKVLNDIYLIPEEFYLPDFSMDAYVKHLSPFYPKFDHQLLKELVNELEITNGKSLTKLSYGQKKKFMIAFAIATNCSYVFMDEPTNGLDIPSKSKFRKIIAGATNEERTFVISTHQVRDLENLIDPIVIIEAGKIIFNQSIESIASSLSFVKSASTESEKGKMFYSEPVFGGNYLVTERTNGEESPVDFELLFNAVLHNRQEIVEHLNN